MSGDAVRDDEIWLSSKDMVAFYNFPMWLNTHFQMISIRAAVLPDASVNAELVLGRGIARLRQERGWTQAHLAELTDVSVTFIAALEHAKRTASIKTINALCSAFAVSPSELFAAGEPQAASSSRRGALARAIAALPVSDDKDAVLLLRTLAQVMKNQRERAAPAKAQRPSKRSARR